MKQFLVLTTALCMLFGGNLFAQDVAVFYDAGIGAVGVNDAGGFANLLVKELKNKKITAEIVDSKGLADYMKANQKGIMLVTMGIMPGTVFKNQGKNDPIYSWLREGGIGGFVGDYAFYYFWDGGRQTAGGAGQQSVFGVTLTVGGAREFTPTEIGKKLMPSLTKWSADRPVEIARLKVNGFEFESYAESDTTHADPIAYRTKDMKGWFINFHTRCCAGALPPNDQMAKEYSELIKNRFIEEVRGAAVAPAGKVSVVWGKLKLGD